MATVENVTPTVNAESVIKSDIAEKKAGSNLATMRAAAERKLAAFGALEASGDATSTTAKSDFCWTYADVVADGLESYDDAKRILESYHAAYDKRAAERGIEKKGAPSAAMITQFANFGHPAVVHFRRELKSGLKEAQSAASILYVDRTKAGEKFKSELPTGYNFLQRIMTQLKALHNEQCESIGRKKKADKMKPLDSKFYDSIKLDMATWAVDSCKDSKAKTDAPMSDTQKADKADAESIAKLKAVANTLGELRDSKVYDNAALEDIIATFDIFMKSHAAAMTERKAARDKADLQAALAARKAANKAKAA